MFELGGHPMVLRANELQLTRGESVRDTALVFSRHVGAIGLRTSSDERLEELAEHATVPVVNLLSPRPPPVPGARRPDDAARGVRRDRGPPARLRGRRQQRRPLAGDPRRAGRRRGGGRRAGGLPARGRRSARELTERSGRGRGRRRRRLHRRLGLDERRRGARPPRAARRSRPTGSTRRCWTAPRRTRSRCTACRPIPGEEITEGVLYGDRQRIWDQAENRRHVFKALLEFLVRSRG